MYPPLSTNERKSYLLSAEKALDKIQYILNKTPKPEIKENHLHKNYLPKTTTKKEEHAFQKIEKRKLF